MLPPPPPTTALLALSPLASTPPPLLTHALPWAEALHDALVKLSAASAAEGGGPSTSLTGRDDFGNPLTGHRHAYILPLAAHPAAPIDHIVVHAPMGLDAPARAAVARIDRVWIRPASLTLRVELLALGSRDDLAARVPILRPSATWTATTPFVPPRYLKPRGNNAIEEQIRAELASRGQPPAEAIEIETDDGGFQPAERVASSVTGEGMAPAARWRAFRLSRQDGAPKPAVRMGFGLRIRFAEPVEGPIALGYASHFGLGQLAPE